ncbi:predicted protein [Sclerotinia sclerotiorum 1980 UF-70]|uniref:Uncharacterized protein n=1 Tax=Sclerotinia sclerotiorum (strain ATCC 18683 / 1980 / Ss-1) TaxID=665079 RepID=A7ERY6_SCLS1|nr:predicted protein [Sclerotinia sclerotiorum 1980 UF-70]EDN92228.1 predicted protein [Sclerotinia sclerotiorum 1980 UF-70]
MVHLQLTQLQRIMGKGKTARDAEYPNKERNPSSFKLSHIAVDMQLITPAHPHNIEFSIFQQRSPPARLRDLLPLAKILNTHTTNQPQCHI